jgi:hypothetical protein
VTESILIPGLPMTGAQLRSTLVALEAEIGSGVEIPALPMSGSAVRTVLQGLAGSISEASGILVQAVAPDQTQGRNGDICFEFDDEGIVRIWGPKALGDWGATPFASFLTNTEGLQPPYSDDPGSPLGAPTSGVDDRAARGDHVHPLPSTTEFLYETAFADNVLSVPVGGAAAQPASVWKEKSVVEALDAILFPEVLPTYTVPTLSSAATVTGIREIGQAISQQLTGVGSKNDAGAFTSISFRRNSTVLSTNNSPIRIVPIRVTQASIPIVSRSCLVTRTGTSWRPMARASRSPTA